MIFKNDRSEQESWDLYHKSMARISELLRHIVLYPNTFYNSTQITFTTKKGKKETITSLIIGPNKNVWLRATSNKLGRLDQDNYHGVQSTDTINFIFISKFPNYCSATYASLVWNCNPLKNDPYNVYCVDSGDKLDYPYDIGSPDYYLIENKFLLNTTIYDANKGAQSM